MHQITVIKKVGNSLLCGENRKDINAGAFVARDYRISLPGFLHNYIHSFEKDSCSADVCYVHAQHIGRVIVLLLNMANRTC